MEIILLILVIIIVYLMCHSADKKYNNRIAPPGYKTDYAAMNYDIASGKPENDVKKKFNRGGYDTPDPYAKKK